VLACGTRFGKSTIGVYECVAALLEPRDHALGWVVAPTYELTKRIFDQVLAILNQRFAHRVLSFDARNHSVIVANLGGGRSELRARSADKPAGLLGESLTFLVVDESAKLRDDVWDLHLAPRLIDQRGWALLISTPGGNNWFFRAFRRGQKRRDPEYESWALPTTDNPHVPADMIEAERKRLAPEEFAQQYLAQFTGVEHDPCDLCKGPKVDAIPVIIVHDDEEPPQCTECGKYVHSDGTTAVMLWPDGQLYTMVVNLQTRPALVTPSLPGERNSNIALPLADGTPPSLPERTS